MSTLSDAADFLSGGTPNKGEPRFWNGNIPWYSASNMNRRFLAEGTPKITVEGLNAGSRIAPAGSTLLLVRGSGLFNHIPICLADEPVAFNQDVKALCAKPHVDSTFLHFWLENLRSTLGENLGVTGIGAGKFDTDFLKGLPFPDLPKEEQKKIGFYAASFDRKIDLNRKMNETLEATARLFFKDWFVDFGPTRAKAEGRPPYLVPELWSLFPDALDDDDKPVGWTNGTLGDVLQQRQERIQPSQKTEILSYVPIECITTKSIFLQDYKPGSEAQSSLILFKQGDIIFGAMRPYFHKVCLAPFDGVTRTTAFVLQPRTAFDRNFSLICAFQDDTIAFATNHSEGSTIPYAKWAGSLETKPIILPSPELRRVYGELIDPLIAKGQDNIEENRSLAALRDLLLPQLMSGEICFRDAEKLVEQVA